MKSLNHGTKNKRRIFAMKKFISVALAILMMLSFLSLIQDGLDRIGLLPSHYKYCGPELQKNIIMYTILFFIH